MTMEEKAKLRDSTLNLCSEGKKKCRLILPIDGWPVDISLPRDLYFEDPQKYCGVVKDFLDDLTIERDDLRKSNFKSLDWTRK